MFNISDKQKIVDYFEKIYMWQKDEVNKVDYFLKTYDYPIYLMTFNELFQIISNQDMYSTPEGEYELNQLEKTFDNMFTSKNLDKISYIYNPELSLPLTRGDNTLSHFRFHHFENEWFCFITEKNTTNIYYISSNHRETSQNISKILISYIHNLKDELSSKKSLDLIS